MQIIVKAALTLRHCAPVNYSDGDVASVHIKYSKRGVAFAPVNSMTTQEVWLMHLSITVKEVWSLYLSITV